MQAHLPPGYRARPATINDAAALADLFNRSSREFFGVDLHDEVMQVADWNTPGFDLASDAVVVEASTATMSAAPVGYAEVWDFEIPHVRIGCWGRVHPDRRGLGIGAWLLEWQERRARAAVRRAPAGARVVLRQGVPERDEGAHGLLESAGFRAVRAFWRMEIDLAVPIPEPTWPDGVIVRAFDPTSDLEPAVRAAREAFRDHWGNVSRPYEQDLELWRHWIHEDDFDPSLWFLATSGSDVVGIGLCAARSPESPDLGSVDSLAVVRSWRRRGIGLALLHHAFRELGRRGKRRVDLGVDSASLTGAQRLYERAGMSPKRRTDLFEKELRPGRDLMTREGAGSTP